MTLARILSVSLLGLDAAPIEVEVDVTPCDKNFLVIVGLPDSAVRESKDRVLTALKNAGMPLRESACTVSLAPGDLKKEGSFYDLPIAIGLIVASKNMSCPHLQDYLIVGELSLSGEVRPIQGALASAMLAKSLGKKGLLLPHANAAEAAALMGIEVYGIKNLSQAISFLKDPKVLKPTLSDICPKLFENASTSIDFADIKGQVHVKRAMEITAAGAHNILLSGPPGCGKTMLAKALLGIIPSLTIEEALEITKIHSVRGMLKEGEHLVKERPFRSPHHTVSYAGLIGGGSNPRPGEVSLAHHGILFLDELPEFSRAVLEVLRQPMEDRQVTISRSQGSVCFPSSFICVAAMNPCPCGYLGHPDKPCIDSATQVARYRNKISGPLWDRLDMHVQVPALRYQELVHTPLAESSDVVRQRVINARAIQRKRFSTYKTNSQLDAKDLKIYCQLNPAGHEVLRQAIEVMGISARGCDRLMRVARTIADLAEHPTILPEHLMEALSFRSS